MNNHRFYFANLNKDQHQLTIDDPKECHHALNVLRLKSDMTVSVINGQGLEMSGLIGVCRRHSLTIEKLTIKRIEAKPNQIPVIIACAIPKRTKFEWLLEKCTELNVDEIIPLKTDRMVKTFPSEAKRQQHWQRYHYTVINALKQSGRLWKPLIHPISSLASILESFNQRQAKFLLLDTRETSQNIWHFCQTYDQKNPVVAFIGPEGDFTDQECQRIKKNGGVSISLGDTILKVETAALIAAILLTQSRSQSHLT